MLMQKHARLAIVAILLLAFHGLSQQKDQPDTAAILERVKIAPAHPRLLWPRAAQQQIQNKRGNDPRLKEAWDAALLTATHQLSEPPVVYRKEGRRLLSRSREALDRITHLSFAFRMTGDHRFVERVEAEIKAMSAMPDWNPSHFLDVAEMTLALAIAYDWLYQDLSPEIRSLGRKAIEEKGLGPYLKPGSKHGWERGGNDWNQVCHAGMLAGALALAEDNPERTALVVRRAVDGLPFSMKVYDPDGNYPEGPSYWHYGTTFNVLAIAMIESALGTDFGLSRMPGFLKAADFPLHTTGPTGLPFNFSDAGAGEHFNPAAFWFASRTSSPHLLWLQWDRLARQVAAVRHSKGRSSVDRLFPLTLVWAEAGARLTEPTDKSWMARGENPLAVFRTSWSNPNALFLAIKGGTPSANHAHMDVGSFVLDAFGERWSMDLGAQGYNELEQRGIRLWNKAQDSDRWKIFRYHNRAHSTLLVNDDEQTVSGRADIISFSPGPENAHAVLDMSKIYNAHLSSAVRRFSFAQRGVTVRDDVVTGKAPAKIRWAIVTRATLKTNGDRAGTLELNGKRLPISVLSPETATLKVWPATGPHDYDAPNPGVSIVGFEVVLKPFSNGSLEVRLGE